MTMTAREILNFVKESDVKFIRLCFCDLFGAQKRISIMTEDLQGAFEQGVSFDAHAIRGFKEVMHSDLFLFPNPTTLTVLPWRPGPGRVASFYCDIKNPDGSLYANDSRNILKQVVARCEKMGYLCKLGPECEFYLFKTDESGDPTSIPFDNGEYLDAPPFDKGGDIRREICLTINEMGIKPESSHHEQGPGQNEIDFRFSDALAGADNLQTLKMVVRDIATRNGLFASFMPKPIKGKPGNGLHVNLSLTENGLNIFKNSDYGHSPIAESFIAGILSKTPEMTAFLNPITNSYERLGEFEAPLYVSWSHQNRSQLIRIPAAGGEKVRIELRSPDPAANPYLAFALILSAGLDGIQKSMVLPPPVDADLYNAPESITKTLTPLPSCLEEAITLAKHSDFIKSVLGEQLTLKYLDIKAEQTAEFAAVQDKWGFYKQKFFKII